MPRFLSCLAGLLPRAMAAASVFAIAIAAAVPANGQTTSAAAPTYPALISPGDPADSLGRYLRMLAANPRDLNALVGAGRAALLVGDPQAAMGFYGRADEISPRNGRIRAGMASAFVQMEQPRAALKLFDEAVALGVPEADIAGDRGLAYDLRGDARRAQADYALALRSRADPETTRRLALSLAISGDRPAALATLDPLLRGGDRAAWRARTFILAMSGDRAGAQSLADRMLPAPQAAAMAPFFGRLATLKPQQKALAVHFGRLPSDSRRADGAELYADAAPAPARPISGATAPPRAAVPTQPARSADASLVPQGRPLGTPARQVALADPAGNAPRRRPGTAEAAAPAIVSSQVPAPDLALGGPSAPESVAAKSVAAKPVAPAPAPPTRMASLVDPSSELAIADPAVAAAKAKAAAEAREKAAAAAKAKADAAARAKADAKAKADARAKAEAEAKARADAAARAEAKAKAAQPERYWVQVASGKNKADLPKVWAKLKADKPSFLNGRSPWVSSWRASNRLLVGPFSTANEAQAFVNRLAKAGMMTMQFTSRAGIPVEKLAAK